MIQELEYDRQVAERIRRGADAGQSLCWTCGSCDAMCPVHVASGRLRPQVMVRLANLGLLEELLRRPEIWYCLGCRRCSQTCPQAVKPAALIEFARREALRRGLFDTAFLDGYRRLFAAFQRVRWRVAAL